MSIQEPSQGSAAELPGANIMLVDDDDDLRESTSALLARHGYAVTSFGNAGEALACLAGGFRPEVILLDLHLPQVSGWELRLALQGDARWADLPVVVMSADGSAQARAIHARAFIAKPFDARRLLATIAAVTRESERLRRRQSNREDMRHSTALFSDVAGHIADDSSEFVQKLELAYDQCLALEQRLSGPARFTVSGVRQLLDSVRIGSRQVHRLAGAAKRAADDALKNTADSGRDPTSSLH